MTELTDQQILEYEQEIKDHDANSVPLIGELQEISALAEEYMHGSKVFLQKIDGLKAKFKSLRRSRGDGNCFYRAIAYSYFELRREQAAKLLPTTPEMLLKVGMQSLAFEDFYDECMEALETQDLLQVFQDAEKSNSIVIYLRFLTSAYLKLHREEYEPFLFEDAIDMDSFCSRNVEAWGREADNLQIIALSKALDVPVHIVYLDSTVASEANIITLEAASGDPIYLLFRPGHYDILYKA